MVLSVGTPEQMQSYARNITWQETTVLHIDWASARGSAKKASIDHIRATGVAYNRPKWAGGRLKIAVRGQR
jgi:hypothetical protein